jgi:DNA-binding transcriptional LysR family regulator
MDFRHLRYFVAVAEEGTFTRAARRLYIGQPALSKQIHDLEEEIGAPLLVRSARGAALTAPGAELLEHARAILQAEAALGVRMRGMADAPAAVLPLGATRAAVAARNRTGERPRAVA